jgi:hypothetical protein
MTDIPFTPPAPRPHATGVRAWLRLLLGAWILSWLPAGYRRLLGRGEALPEGFLAAFDADAPHHVAMAALGLIPDWIMAGVRNRGMRPTPVLRPHAPRRAARDPPLRPVGCRPAASTRLDHPWIGGAPASP